jgi:hypothetical protein
MTTREITREFAERVGMSKAAIEEFVSSASVYPDGEIWIADYCWRMIPEGLRKEIMSYGSTRIAGDMEIFTFDAA